MKELTFYICALLVMVGCYYFYDSFVCGAKTNDMGFNSRWSIVSGCLIEVEQNKWIPLESYYFKEE